MKVVKVLMIVTSHDRLGSTGRPTGLFLSDLSRLYLFFTQRGMKVDIASPRGGKAPIDPISAPDPDAEPYAHLADTTLKLSAIEAGRYSAVVLVGGHGAMFDFPEDPHLHRILGQVDSYGRVVAAISHGQAGLLNAKSGDGSGDYFVTRRRVTGFSNAEQTQVGLTEAMPFSLQDKLLERGARYMCTSSWQEHVVSDYNLVTGQNPASATRLAESVAELAETVASEW